MDPSKWFLFPFKDRFSGDDTQCFFHVRGAIVADQFSGEVFKKLLMFKQLSHIMTKPIKWHVCPVWSKSSLYALWVAKDHTVLHAKSKDWSDWADAQVDLSLCWAHIPICWFCLDVTQLLYSYVLSANVFRLIWYFRFQMYVAAQIMMV